MWEVVTEEFCFECTLKYSSKAVVTYGDLHYKLDEITK